MSPKATASKKSVKKVPAKKAAAKKPAAKKPRKSTAASNGRMTPPSKGVKVRMYRTGLGDCFLLAFRKGRSTRDAFYLMIDCGVYFKTPEPGNVTRIKEIVENIRDATGGRLDVLVITHEHWDHVSGFHPTQAQKLFADEIKLGELWMAWTEDLRISLARDLHEGRVAARNALAQALTRMQGFGAQSATAELVGKMLDFFGPPVEAQASAGMGAAGGNVFGAKKSVQTEESMEWLRDTYGKDRTRFLKPGEDTLSLSGVSGVRVYVLGPPEDSVLIKRTDPSGDEVYPKAMAAAVEASFFAACGAMPESHDSVPTSDDLREARSMSIPFDDVYQIPFVKVQKAAEAGDTVGAAAEPLFRGYFDSKDKWRRVDGDWLEAAGEFALQLDNATNNTSLALAIEVGPPGEGKILLFPGDAQVGNWRSWFGKVKLGQRELGKDMVWRAGDRKVTAEDLLRRTVLYKVGHHGSHNATLRQQGLELMGRSDGTAELVAFLPVDEHVARDLAHYGEMPLRSLVKELAIRTGGRIVRNDEGATPKDAESTLAPIEGAPRIRSSKSFLDASTDLYFEYTVTPPATA
ncbi:MAG TPA: hypothetical protein VH394_03630 [Thermoanaerobaculia bacterium]|jgi:hypothetical protein|nr:hypothetical protein [Thermoanaerobaculia bacterium]